MGALRPSNFEPAATRPMSQASKSVLHEPEEIHLAIELINNGARLKILEIETTLSRERLITLHKELKGISPSKGMLPSATDWFLTWQPNIHASLFFLIRRKLLADTGLTGIRATSKAYKIYLEQLAPIPGEPPVLSFTRAWTLLRFLSNAMLSSAKCTQCGGEFIVQPKRAAQFVCGLCKPPSRAGKTRKPTKLATDPVTDPVTDPATEPTPPAP